MGMYSARLQVSPSQEQFSSIQVEDCHVVWRGAVSFYPWGMLLTVSSTKTIQYGQRTIKLPITYAPGSPLCAVFWLQQHFQDIPVRDASSTLFLVTKGSGHVPLSYSKVLSYIKLLLREIGRDPESVGLHSLRRAGSSCMRSIGLTLEDIRQAGDWQSLAALIYLAHPLQGKTDTDRRVPYSLLGFNNTI